MVKNQKFTAIYARVSSNKQSTKSQMPDLDLWEANHTERTIKRFKDTFTGRTMKRPGWKKIEEGIRRGQVDTVVVWRLDRLGRTVAGLASLFDELQERKINLVSVKDGVDLSTPAGRLMANVIASVAQYEVEILSEKTKAGQAVARKNGKRWGGSKPGTPKKLTPPMVRTVKRLKHDGLSISAIANEQTLSRTTVYKALEL